MEGMLKRVKGKSERVKAKRRERDGYWFIIKDTTDPCQFALVSNQEGIIYTAHPIR
jgi:hypothetical protein